MKAQERGKVFLVLGYAATCLTILALAGLYQSLGVAQFSVCVGLLALIGATYWMPQRPAQVVGGLAAAAAALLPLFADRIFGEGTSSPATMVIHFAMLYLVIQYRKPTPPPAEPTADAKT